MPKPLVPKFRLDMSARLKGIAEKQVPAKLKPIVGAHLLVSKCLPSQENLMARRAQ